ncbi:MAG: hypothetical protein WD273_00400 [Trueperaceae bacterium]
MSSKWVIAIVAIALFGAAMAVGMWIKLGVQERERLQTAADAKGIEVDLYADIQERMPRIEKDKSLTASDRTAIELYANSDNPAVRRYAIVFTNLGLHQSAPEEVTEFAKRFIDDESARVRATAYMILYKRNPKGWEQYRARLEADPDPSVSGLVTLFEGEENETSTTKQQN